MKKMKKKNKWEKLLSRLSKIEIEMINPKYTEEAFLKYKKIINQPKTFEIWKESLTMEEINEIFKRHEDDYLTGGGFNRYKNHSAEEVDNACKKYEKIEFKAVKKQVLERLEAIKKTNNL